MIDSIFVALSGLAGHQKGLKVISNNVANMNTPGYRGSSLNFKDLVSGDGRESTGGGVEGSRTSLDLRAGEFRSTGRDLDLALEGDGYFVVRDEAGALRYTRDGAFEFNSAGVLVGRSHGLEVMARDSSGRLGSVDLQGLRAKLPRATTEISFTGNLSSGDDEHSIDSVVVYDRAGTAHTLRFVFSPDRATDPGGWRVRVLEGTTEIGVGPLSFTGASPTEGSESVTLSLALRDTEAAEISLNLGTDVTSFSSGTLSTLALDDQDGYAAGTITRLSFDARGVLKITYSNQESVDGPALALADVRDDGQLTALGAGLYVHEGVDEPTIRSADDGLRVTGQNLELSNVDLTQEFSALILMQRGYQASSQVLSTANEMLQELFGLKGRR